MSSTKLSRSFIDNAIETYLRDFRSVERQNRHLKLRRLQDLGTPEENRYLDDKFVPLPDYLKFSKMPARFGYLSDGRRVWLLGEDRVRTLCGLSEVLWVSPAMISDQPISVGKMCQYCGGKHVQHSPRVKALVPRPEVSESSMHVVCNHCSGVQVECSYFQKQLALHCNECGWFLELYVNRSGHFNLRSELSQRNFNENKLPQSDFENEVKLKAWGNEVSVENEDCEEDGVVLEGGESESCILDAQLDEDQESLEDPIEQLIANFHKLWSKSTWKSLRNEVLTMSIVGQIPREKVDMVWMAISSLLESCQGLSKNEQTLFVKQLNELSRTELIALIPELLAFDEDAEPIMPIVQLKIQRWINGCKKRVRRFRVKDAGIKKLAPQIGVSPEVLRKVCQ